MTYCIDDLEAELALAPKPENGARARRGSPQALPGVLVTAPRDAHAFRGDSETADADIQADAEGVQSAGLIPTPVFFCFPRKLFQRKQV